MKYKSVSIYKKIVFLTATLLLMYKNTFLYSSFLLLCTLSFILIISNITFLFNYDINTLNTLLSFLISIILLIYISKKPLEILASVFVAILFSVLSYYLAITYFDTSYDGQGYHQETIYLLKNGWNPIYEESNAFRMWINHYQKGNEIIQSNIYFLTDQIESGKMINLLLLFIAIFTSFTFLDTLKIKFYFKFLLIFIVVFNPVVFTQLFTYYLDANWYLALVISLSSLLSYYSTKKQIFLIIFVLSAVIFCSLKLTSIPVFIVLSIFAVSYHFAEQKKILFKPFLSIFILSIICNINPFLTNLKNGFHILYPFAGENKSDILNQNIPIMLLNKNRIERILISLFSETTDNRDAILLHTLKIPFAVSIDQLFINYDTRLGGFGFFFSGVLVISLLLAIYILFIKTNKLQKKSFIILFMGILCSILINPASWWARLSAQIWLLPIVIIIFGLLSQNKIAKVLSQLSIVIFMINILIPGYITYRKLNDDNKIMNNFVDSVGNKTIILDLNNQFGFQQYYLKFKERNISYKIRDVQKKIKLAPYTRDVYYEIETK